MSKALRGPVPLNPDNKKGDGSMPSPAMGGGDKGDRTPDLMTASHALSQLSYIPVGWCESYINRSARSCKPESAFVWIEDKNSSFKCLLETKLLRRMRRHKNA